MLRNYLPTSSISFCDIKWRHIVEDDINTYGTDLQECIVQSM